MLDVAALCLATFLLLRRDMGVVKEAKVSRRKLISALGAGVVVGAAAGFTAGRFITTPAPPVAAAVEKVITERKLTTAHAVAAFKTYV
ncbi:MAG: hypothetical protein QW801_06030, partial [Candidatus Caldarchaeum sp.]